VHVQGVSIVRDPNQDTTDLEKTLSRIEDLAIVHAPILVSKLAEANVCTWILGGLGGNFSQQLANINTLYSFAHLRPVLVSDENICFHLAKGFHKILTYPKLYCGIFPLSHTARARTQGLQWNLGMSCYRA
jgi:thiamine pyrophosphokinase